MKKQILIITDWFLPAFKAGGPIQSISNLVTHLKNDFDFWIYTSNSDLNETLDIPSNNLNTWIKYHESNIKYTDVSHQNIKFLIKLFNKNNFDVVYINSLFSFKFSILPLILAKWFKIKIILAPRGMLGFGALAIKPFKKKLFLKVFRFIKFYDNITWHATDLSELDEIKFHFGDKTNVKVAPNLIKKTVEPLSLKNKQTNHLKLFFLSRIAIKKNLLGAIQILNLLPKSINIEFTIVGPVDEANYWKDCQTKLDDLHNNVKAFYLGAIANHKLNKILKDQHVMILPTQHENFGHVIMESWQLGCPVVISKNTPWKSLESKHLGYDLENNSESYVKALCHFAKMNQKEFDKWSQASFEFSKGFSESKVLIDKTVKLFF